MGVLDGFRGVWEESAHLLLGLHIVLSALVAHTVLVGDLFPCLDTEQNVVGLPVLGVDVVAVVCRHKRDI